MGREHLKARTVICNELCRAIVEWSQVLDLVADIAEAALLAESGEQRQVLKRALDAAYHPTKRNRRSQRSSGSMRYSFYRVDRKIRRDLVDKKKEAQ